jgi:hypothetical protein
MNTQLALGSTMSPKENRAQRWRALAKQARQLAQQMSGNTARQAMVEIAEEYERLAKSEERKSEK